MDTNLKKTLSGLFPKKRNGKTYPASSTSFKRLTLPVLPLHKLAINTLLTFPCNWLYRLQINNARSAHARLSVGVEDFAHNV